MSEFMIVSYYTEGTGYVDEMRRLVESMNKFHLDYDVIAVHNRGSWLNNVNYKPTFCKEMLLKHKKPIVWLDADAEVMRYPNLFEELKCDIAFHYRRRLARMELLTGTLYLNYNFETVELLDKWIHLCKLGRNIWEQRLLQGLIEAGQDVRITELPASYVKIFDANDMNTEEKPVIVHWQASRRLKWTV